MRAGNDCLPAPVQFRLRPHVKKSERRSEREGRGHERRLNKWGTRFIISR